MVAEAEGGEEGEVLDFLSLTLDLRFMACHLAIETSLTLPTQYQYRKFIRNLLGSNCQNFFGIDT